MPAASAETDHSGRVVRRKSTSAWKSKTYLNTVAWKGQAGAYSRWARNLFREIYGRDTWHRHSPVLLGFSDPRALGVPLYCVPTCELPPGILISDTVSTFVNRDGCNRYPFLVRTWHFFNLSPLKFTVMLLHPLLGFACG